MYQKTRHGRVSGSMFDYHLHTRISFDSITPAKDILKAAEVKGLSEICFTDHYDFNDDRSKKHNIFDIEAYRREFDGISSDTVKVRRGVEFGLTPWNKTELKTLTDSYPFDFVIGSVHYAGGFDPYEREYFERESTEEAFLRYLEQVLECVRVHEGFDVLGHINYACKSPNNRSGKYLHYMDFRNLADDIMKALSDRGLGMEINTSSFSRFGDFLPSREYLKRFRELGGEIVTVGSDAHTTERVGENTDKAIALAGEIFGYVCTFDGRKPIFHIL